MADEEKKKPVPKLKIKPPNMTEELEAIDIETIEPPELRATMEITTDDLNIVNPPSVPVASTEEE